MKIRSMVAVADNQAPSETDGLKHLQLLPAHSSVAKVQGSCRAGLHVVNRSVNALTGMLSTDLLIHTWFFLTRQVVACTRNLAWPLV
jgi:hypothetical protein